MSFPATARKRTARASDLDLLLLAPEHVVLPGTFRRARPDKDRYHHLLADMQRFRGAIYVQDGAITPQALDSAGRHRLDIDLLSWHVIAVNEYGDVCGCSRYSSHAASVDFSNLAVGRSAMAQSDVWGAKLKSAVERERRFAAKENTSFVEVGGWAISEAIRGTSDALRIALATYALARKIGGGIGVTTATVRHHASSILRKIGGSPLLEESVELPRYFDPEYDCEMEILRFHSATPNPKFLPWIEQINVELSTVEVLISRSNARAAVCAETDLQPTWAPALA